MGKFVLFTVLLCALMPQTVLLVRLMRFYRQSHGCIPQIYDALV